MPIQTASSTMDDATTIRTSCPQSATRVAKVAVKGRAVTAKVAPLTSGWT